MAPSAASPAAAASSGPVASRSLEVSLSDEESEDEAKRQRRLLAPALPPPHHLTPNKVPKSEPAAAATAEAVGQPPAAKAAHGTTAKPKAPMPPMVGSALAETTAAPAAEAAAEPPADSAGEAPIAAKHEDEAPIDVQTLMRMLQQQQAAAAQQQAAAAKAAETQAMMVQTLIRQNETLMATLERERSRSRSRDSHGSTVGSACGRRGRELNQRPSAAPQVDRVLHRLRSPARDRLRSPARAPTRQSTGKGYGSAEDANFGGSTSSVAPGGHGEKGGWKGGGKGGGKGRGKDGGKSGGRHHSWGEEQWHTDRGGRHHSWGDEQWHTDRGGWDAGQVEYFTGSQKNTRATARHIDSDEDELVEACEYRYDHVIRWDHDSDDAHDFDAVSREVMRSDWSAVAQMLRDRPELCAMRVPEDAEVAAGYGLIHTLCTKACPDDITDYVLNRTPRQILSIGGHKRGSTRELSSPELPPAPPPIPPAPPPSLWPGA